MYPDLPHNIHNLLLEDLIVGYFAKSTYLLIKCYLTYWEQLQTTNGSKSPQAVTDRRIRAYWGQARKNLRCKQAINARWRKLGLPQAVINYKLSSTQKPEQIFVASLKVDGNVKTALRKVNKYLVSRFNVEVE